MTEETYLREQVEYTAYAEQEHNRFLTEATEGEAARAALDARAAREQR